MFSVREKEQQPAIDAALWETNENREVVKKTRRECMALKLPD